MLLIENDEQTSFVAPQDVTAMTEFTTILEAIMRGDCPGVLCTLVKVTGSSYRPAGARLWLGDDGTRIGSISGGCLEADLAVRAQAERTSGTSSLVTYDTTTEADLIWGVGTGCHGVVTVLLEFISQPPEWATVTARNLSNRQSTSLAVIWDSRLPSRCGTHLAPDRTNEFDGCVFWETIQPAPVLVLFGAGDDAIPLVEMSALLGWEVTVADVRPEFATCARFPKARRVRVIGCEQDLEEQGLSFDDRTAAVVMTHHYRHDRPLLRQLLRRSLPYLGLLGPRRRAEKILADLAAENDPPHPQRVSQLRAPVGLDLGANAPETIALSIIAEIQAVFATRSARPLRERNQPIHS